MTGSPTSSTHPYPAVDIIAFFKTRSALVIAAVVALDALPVELAKLRALVAMTQCSSLNDPLHAVDRLIQGATIGTDNLLVANAVSVHEPFVLCSVNRQPSGAVDVKTIEIDRDTLALAGAPRGQSGRPFNTLAATVHALMSEQNPKAINDVETAIDALSAQVRASVSRLSIIKARLDLQQSFLSSVMDADVGSLRLDSHLDEAGVRDMALEARRLLSNPSRKIAGGNRTTIASLFEGHAAKDD